MGQKKIQPARLNCSDRTISISGSEPTRVLPYSAKTGVGPVLLVLNNSLSFTHQILTQEEFLDDATRRSSPPHNNKNQNQYILMKHTIISTLILTLTATTLSLLARDSNQPIPRPGQGRPVPPMLAALDANQDGVIDASELANATSALTRLDTNQDGQLTADELHPGRPEDGHGRGGKGGRKGHEGSGEPRGHQDSGDHGRKHREGKPSEQAR